MTASNVDSAPAVPAAVDVESLSELTEGDMDFARELVETYISSSAEILAQMRASVASLDRDQLRKSAHQLKGASANIHATQLHALCNALETNAAHLDEPALRSTVDQVGMEITRSGEELQRYLRASKSAA